MNETRVQARADCCGEVRVPADRVELVIVTDAPPFYCFHCPECGAFVTRLASYKVIGLLGAAGCKTFGEESYTLALGDLNDSTLIEKYVTEWSR